MGNLRSKEKRKRRYDWNKAHNLFLQYSFNDKLLAETVHTKETEEIVFDVLKKEFPKVYRDIFHSSFSNCQNQKNKFQENFKVKTF